MMLVKFIVVDRSQGNMKICIDMVGDKGEIG